MLGIIVKDSNPILEVHFDAQDRANLRKMYQGILHRLLIPTDIIMVLARTLSK